MENTRLVYGTRDWSQFHSISRRLICDGNYRLQARQGCDVARTSVFVPIRAIPINSSSESESDKPNILWQSQNSVKLTSASTQQL